MTKKETDTESYLVTMTRVSDGKVVEFTEEGYNSACVDQDDHINFVWGDGNYSCDCNRYLEFKRNLDRSQIVDIHQSVPCGEGMFKVTIKNIRTGKIVLEEK